MSITFFVPGLPQPGGSKRAFYIKKLGRAVITDANAKAKPWKATVAAYAREQYAGQPLDGPLKVTMIFTMPRPKYHFGKHGRKANAPIYHTVKPDSTKLLRSTEDALTGILWRDDSQVMPAVTKVYGDLPGVQISVEPLLDFAGVETSPLLEMQ